MIQYIDAHAYALSGHNELTPVPYVLHADRPAHSITSIVSVNEMGKITP